MLTLPLGVKNSISFNCVKYFRPCIRHYKRNIFHSKKEDAIQNFYKHFPDLNDFNSRITMYRVLREFYRRTLCSELLQECNVNLYRVYNVNLRESDIPEMNINDLKHEKLIKDPESLVDRLLNYLEPFPFDKDAFEAIDQTSLFTKYKNINSIAFKRDVIEKHHLAWKYKVDIKFVNSIYSKNFYLFYKNRSLRSFRRNLDILQKEKSINHQNIQKDIYLLNQQPFSRTLVLDFDSYFSEKNWFELVNKRHFKGVPLHLFEVILFKAILLVKNFSKEQIEECFPLLIQQTPASFISKMTCMLNNSALSIYRTHKKFLRFFYFPMKKLNSFSSSISFEDMLIRSEYKRSQQYNGRNLLRPSLNTYFGIDKEFFKNLTKLPNNEQIYDEHLISNFEFLKSKNFTKEEIAETLVILLYPRDRIERALKKVEENCSILSQAGFLNGCVPEETKYFKSGTKLKQKTLQLCLYYIQESVDFAWNFVGSEIGVTS